MNPGDLTSLDSVKGFLGLGAGTESDTTLSRLIRSRSGWFKTQTRRDILWQRYVEPRNGNGTIGISPFQYPVVDVESVVVDGEVIPKQPKTVPYQPPQFGWVLVADRIEMVQYTGSLAPYIVDYAPYYYGAGGPRFTFTRGFGNILLAYWAGYAVLEYASVPASAPLSVETREIFYADIGVFRASQVAPDEGAAVPGQAPFTIQSQQYFAGDNGVRYASTNVALTKVGANPAQGQYTVSDTGLYTFNQADSGVSVVLKYLRLPGQSVYEPGAAMTKVALPDDPTTLAIGQYAVNDTGEYVFSPADAGQGVMLKYAYVPADIEAAVREMVAWDFKGRDRLGQRSKAVGGEVITFLVDECSDAVKAVIDKYSRAPGNL